jgi:hypothetical protein
VKRVEIPKPNGGSLSLGIPKYKENNRHHPCISRQKTGAWICLNHPSNRPQSSYYQQTLLPLVIDNIAVQSVEKLTAVNLSNFFKALLSFVSTFLSKFHRADLPDMAQTDE